MEKRRIALIGLGQMARALARGWCASGLVNPDQLWGYDPAPAACARFQSEVGPIQLGQSAGEAVGGVDIVLLAVKPQVLPVVASGLAAGLTADHLVLSIAAGVTLDQLCGWLGTDRVVRVMPNTPCLVGQGAAAITMGPATLAEDRDVVSQLFQAVGRAVVLDHRYMDAVTGLSGSGPAYVYQMIEALSDGGVRVGLPRQVATMLAAQTVRGAAEMVLQSNDHPAALKDAVTSPGGTTIAGLEALESHGMRAACIAAVVAATRRAGELRGEADG